ncbi:hypothetical protein bcere0004_41360 [Bacillus cereus BGSC 6E1]|nr:hypothetical protein bcere0004_41360 [Bacillus cereus BGSC 6E1]
MPYVINSINKICNSTFSFKIVATEVGKYGDVLLVSIPNHLFKRLMVQNIKTPDQLAMIAFCLIFVSRSSSVIQGLAVLSLLKNPFIYPHIIMPIKMVSHFICMFLLSLVKSILHI